MNRAVLFEHLRKAPFPGQMSLSQVTGTEVILDVWEAKYRERTSLPQLADCLATTFHETAFTMQPIKEIGSRSYFMRMYDKTGARPQVAARLGNTEVGDGAKFPGMGDVQLTGRANYAKATQKLRKLGLIDSGVDFVVNPELVMQPRLAALIMFEGMEEGWFTGVKLDDVIDEKTADQHAKFVRARRIINGTDRAEKIATYADQFLKALQAATGA